MTGPYITIDQMRQFTADLIRAHNDDNQRFEANLGGLEQRLAGQIYRAETKSDALKAQIEVYGEKAAKDYEELKASIIHVAQQQVDLRSQANRLAQGQAALQASVGKLVDGQTRIEQGQIALQASVAKLTEVVGTVLARLPQPDA
ncbi:MAG TPA: hypothetical protein VH593_29700 [Ktedonobacteraceae bacterium]